MGRSWKNFEKLVQTAIFGSTLGTNCEKSALKAKLNPKCENGYKVSFRINFRNHIRNFFFTSQKITPTSKLDIFYQNTETIRTQMQNVVFFPQFFSRMRTTIVELIIPTCSTRLEITIKHNQFWLHICFRPLTKIQKSIPLDSI